MALVNRMSRTVIRGFGGVDFRWISPARTLSTWTSHQARSKSRAREQISLKTRLVIYASSAATAYALSPLSSLSPSTATSLTLARAEFSTSASSTSPKQASISSPPEIVLYQYEVCPFCNKVRAYLDYHGIPYQVVEVDPLRKTELKDFSEDYRKVPIALINNKQVNGSGAVIETVRSLVETGDKTRASDLEKRWLGWLDDHLIHLIAPNIYRTPGESLQTFNYIAEKGNFSSLQRSTIRYIGAAAMYVIGKRLKKKYNVADEREAIHGAVAEWMGGVRDTGGVFLNGGDRPGVADLSVYGVLKAISTFDTFADIRTRNEEFAQWFDRMKLIVGDSLATN